MSANLLVNQFSILKPFIMSNNHDQLQLPQSYNCKTSFFYSLYVYHLATNSPDFK